MLTITVAQDGSGDFSTISEAVLAVPYELEAEVRIGPGSYREKLICEKRRITLRGAGAEATRLVWADGGRLPPPDGRPTHTFRSYTAFFSGEWVTVEDMPIENAAGPGSEVGQAVAAYVDSQQAVFRRVRLLGNQDTLFCAPLPETEREKDGFLGPRKLAPRRPSARPGPARPAAVRGGGTSPGKGRYHEPAPAGAGGGAGRPGRRPGTGPGAADPACRRA